MAGAIRAGCCAWLLAACAAGAEPWQPIERQIPPLGTPLAAEDRDAIETKLRAVAERIEGLRRRTDDAGFAPLFADVEIYHKAVLFARDQNEFYRPDDVGAAHELLATAAERLDHLAAGRHPWTTAKGLVVRGYRSTIDDSPQPYGLVIPEKLDATRPAPLYVWLHGRNDRLTDLAFIYERQHQAGRAQPAGAIVLHPFGRSCLGWKSAAEIDVLDAVESVKERYAIDPQRIVLMGFSMGGAGAWHLGAHYADRWVGVHAGAGFVDVARYGRLRVADYPPWYEQKLWGVYDVPDYVRNLFNLPVVAYSGELDKQKDAADFMAEAYHAEGHQLEHLIGPAMGHEYAPAAWQDVMRRMEAAATAGRDPRPSQVSLQTRTLRYHRAHWVEALAFDEHWNDSRIDARYVGPELLAVETLNIRALRLTPPRPVKALTIDGQEVGAGQASSRYERRGQHWALAEAPVEEHVEKRPGLQGPIDDAFLAPFLVVLPTGPAGADVKRWVDFEIDHFQRRWRNVYRGVPRTKRDVDVTDDDVARFHLVAWGDPQSNALVRRVADRLPVRWTDAELVVGPRRFDRTRHLPLAVYPNPLAPDRYLVLNSGPTHREAHDRTNSLQNPKLPDWAVVDVTVSPDAARCGGVVAAGFFDEQWQIKPDHARASGLLDSRR